MRQLRTVGVRLLSEAQHRGLRTRIQRTVARLREAEEWLSQPNAEEEAAVRTIASDLLRATEAELAYFDKMLVKYGPDAH
jgi:hypothetical protein